MKRMPTVPAFTVGVAVFWLAGCESSTPVDPGEHAAAATAPADALASERGRQDGTVAVPITLRLLASFTVPGASATDCPDLIDPETGELFTAVGTGEGQANHMGRVRFTGAHPTINLCSVLEGLPPAPPDVARTGQMELVAADGSTLEARYEFLLVPPELGGFMTVTVQGGTRRFQGASGQLELNWEKSGDLVCGEDPLCLEEGSIDSFFEEALTLPRP